MMITKLLKNKYLLIFSIYVIILIFFVTFSYKLMFHDTWEYISVAKKFAGFLNGDMFSVHSLVYPFFISLFVRIFPSILTMKLVNVSWIILIGILLYRLELRKTAFVIWIFSPIAWMASPVTSPFLPSSFFLLVAYLMIKKWRETNKDLYFVISALALGLSASFSDICVILAPFFVLAFFYDKRFKKVIFYTLCAFLSFSTRLILDAALFSLAINGKIFPFPIYSLVRFFGARSIIQLGLHPMISVTKLSIGFESWGFIILISPLLFYLCKINYQKNKQVIFFLILSTALFIFQGGSHLYFILLAPIAITLLSETFTKKELIFHIITSLFIIILMVNSYFIQDKQEIEKRNLVINDLRMISKDFSFNAVVFNTDTSAIFYLWDKNIPYFISREERDKILKNDIYYTHYSAEVKSEIGTQKVLEIQAGLKTNIKEGIDYKGLPWLLEKEELVPEGYKLTKCYALLCVYQK